MKRSLVMVKPHVPLSMLAPFELEILSRVLFQYIEGLSAEHNTRWRRFWRRWLHSNRTQGFYPDEERSGAFHARHMAIEDRIYEHQDGFVQRKAFRLWLKTGAVFGNFVASGGALVFEPSSLSYEDCSDDEMREFHEDAIEFLRTPLALATLWPAMSEDDRMETLESLLRKPDDE